MTRRQRYFMKQKLMGVLAILIAVATMVVFKDPELSGAAVIIFIPIGLHWIFTKEMALTDDYYFEMEERKKRGRRHS